MPKQIPIIQLRPGMKVVKTDIDWDKMPFWQAPFVVSTSEDIVRLHTCCTAVYIDDGVSGEAEDETDSKNRSSDIDAREPSSAKENVDHSPAVKPDLHVVRSPSDIRKEKLREKVSPRLASQSYHKTLSVLRKSFDSIRKGQPLQADLLESSMRNLMISSVARPETLAILCNLKQGEASLEQKSLDVAVLSLMFGNALGMNNRQLLRLGLAAMLHDAGMLKIPPVLLNEQSEFSAKQRSDMQKHVQYSCQLMNVSERLIPLKSIIAFHHERFDGKGYPRGIKGNRTPLEARIIHLVCAYEAMTRKRHYARRLSPTQAMREIYRLRNKDFDPRLAERFIKSMGVYPPGTLVQLNNGFVGMVVEANEQQASRPLVQLIFNQTGEMLDNPDPVDLNTSAYAELKVIKAIDPEKISMDSLGYIRQAFGLAA